MSWCDPRDLIILKLVKPYGCTVGFLYSVHDRELTRDRVAHKRGKG